MTDDPRPEVDEMPNEGDVTPDGEDLGHDPALADDDFEDGDEA